MSDNTIEDTVPQIEDTASLVQAEGTDHTPQEEEQQQDVVCDMESNTPQKDVKTDFPSSLASSVTACLVGAGGSKKKSTLKRSETNTVTFIIPTIEYPLDDEEYEDEQEEEMDQASGGADTKKIRMFYEFGSDEEGMKQIPPSEMEENSACALSVEEGMVASTRQSQPALSVPLEVPKMERSSRKAHNKSSRKQALLKRKSLNIIPSPYPSPLPSPMESPVESPAMSPARRSPVESPVEMSPARRSPSPMQTDATTE